MKNLKKVLSLVLALAMALSLMTVAFAADASDYKDYNDVTYKEAVDVMTAAGIFNGTGDGTNFTPDGTLTREQAAKIITYMLVGQEQADKLTTTIAPYSDVAASRWSAGAIAYCTNEGIIAGTGDGTFQPTKAVTGLEFAKMLLVALGYDASIEKLEGPAWAINTSKLALSDPALDNGMEEIALSASLTREQAAQMAFNAMKADIVEYDAQTSIDIDGTQVNVGNTKAQAVTTIRDWGKNISDDGVTGTVNTGNPYTVQFAEQYCRDLTKVVSTQDDVFGRPAVEWKYDKTNIGTYADEADYVYAGEVTRGDLYGDVGKSVVEDLADASETGAVLNVYIDGRHGIINSKDSANINQYFDKDNSTVIGGSPNTGNGTSTEVYVGDDNDVTVVIINTYLVQATDDYNTRKESVTIQTVGNVTAPITATSISSDDFDVTDVQEDDYLLITCAGTGATGKDIESVEPANVVTGVVNSYSSEKSVTIAGEKYEYAFKADTSTTAGTKVAYEIGEETTVVTDKNGYILYVDEVTVASDKYVYIEEVAQDGNFTTNASYQAKAYFLDGTYKVINIKDKLADDTAVSASTPAGWYRYTVNNSDVYTLGALVAGAAENNTGTTTTITTNGTKLVENGKVDINAGQTGAIKANNSTIFVVIDNDDNVAAYTGIANVPTIAVKDNTAVTAKYVVASNTNYAKYVFIDASDASIDGATSASGDFILLLSYDSTNKDADKNDYYTYKALVNGEQALVNLNDNFTANDSDASNKAGALYTDVKYDENGYVDRMNVVDSGDDYTTQTMTDASIDYEDGVLTISGNDYVVDADCAIYLVAADTNVKEDAGADAEIFSNISANTLYTLLKDYNNHIDGVYYAQVDDDSNTMVTLYVVVNNTNA